MKVRRLAAALAVPVALGAALAVAGTAQAATPVTYVASIGNIPVTTIANGAGYGAVVNAADTLSLTVGSAAGGYAQADLALPAGSVLPSTAPTFTTDNFSTGSPRWVIQLGNGDELMNNYESSTVSYSADASAPDWSALVAKANGGSGGWGTATTYQAAVAAVGGYGEGAQNAFIVADGDQAAGTTDLISHVQYGGKLMTVKALTAPRPHLTGGHVITVNDTRAEIGWTDHNTSCVMTRTFGPNMTSASGAPHVGFTCGTTGYWSGLKAGAGYDVELIPASGTYGDPVALPDAQVGWIYFKTTS